MNIHPKLLLLLALLVLQSCIDLNDFEDLESPNYNASFAIPLVNSSVSLKELLDEFEDVNTIRIDDEGLIHLMYRGDLIRQTGEEVFSELIDGFPPFVPILNKELSIPVNSFIENAQIDRLDLKEGRFVYYLENNNTEAIEVTFNFPSIQKDGEALSFTANIPAFSGSGTRPFATNQDAPIDISSYSIVPINDNIEANYSATNASGDEVNATNFVIRLDDLAISYAQGYLGQVIFEGGQDTIPIDFFDTYIDGTIFFTDPKVSFLVDNAFGVPTRSVVNSFLVETVRGEILEVESPLIETGVDFPYPPLSAIGSTEMETYVFTKENSNVDDLLSSGPIYIAYDIDALLNPEGDTSITGFLTDSSFYNVQMEVDLPLFGTASGFVASDTVDFDLGDDLENIDSVELKLVTENELGVDIAVQGIFLDENDVVLDSLFMESTPIIRGASVDDSGIPTGVVEEITFVDFFGDRLEQIKQANSLILRVNFSTESNGILPVKTLETHQVNIRMGGILSISEN